jgi:hypothetical protein
MKVGKTCPIGSCEDTQACLLELGLAHCSDLSIHVNKVLLLFDKSKMRSHSCDCNQMHCFEQLPKSTPLVFI